MKCKNCGQSSEVEYNVTINEFLFKTGIEKKKIVKDFYKPKSKPMPIVKYIDTMNPKPRSLKTFS